jgi:hypothetical protein
MVEEALAVCLDVVVFSELKVVNCVLELKDKKRDGGEVLLVDCVRFISSTLVGGCRGCEKPSGAGDWTGASGAALTI